MVIDVVTLQVLPEDLPELVCRQNGLRGWLVRPRNGRPYPVLCQNSAQPASTKELRLSKSGETLAHEQVTRRPPTLDCGSTFERAAGR